MNSPVKILYIITSTNAGGTEKALFELIRRIDRNEYSVYVCSLKKPGVFAQKIAANTEGFYSLGLSEAGGLRAVLNFPPSFVALVKLLRKLKPHIIHSFLFRANIVARLAGRVAGVPIIISSIRVIESGKWYKHLVDRLTSSMVDRYLAVSEGVRKFTIAHAHIPEDKIVTIYNGIDCSNTAPAVPPGFIVNKDFTNIALVGRFERQKGHAVLIKALKLFLVQEEKLKVYFFGEGPDEKQVRKMVQRAGVSKYVIFMGVVGDILPYIALMDIIVLPSLWEGLPNVVLEAMSVGRAVVASQIQGVDEIVVDGQTGILCEPENEKSLAEALLGLSKNKDRANALGQWGRQRVQELFSIDTTVKTTVDEYRGLLKKKAGTSCSSGQTS